MPKLITVTYRTFSCDKTAIDAVARSGPHDIGGEVLLTFDDCAKLIISWVNAPVQYSIGIKESPHFQPDADLTYFDVSDSGMWADLVGQDVSFKFVARCNQALEVSSAYGHLLLCSFENEGWCADSVTISKQRPAPPIESWLP